MVLKYGTCSPFFCSKGISLNSETTTYPIFLLAVVSRSWESGPSWYCTSWMSAGSKVCWSIVDHVNFRFSASFFFCSSSSFFFLSSSSFFAASSTFFVASCSSFFLSSSSLLSQLSASCASLLASFSLFLASSSLDFFWSTWPLPPLVVIFFLMQSYFLHFWNFPHLYRNGSYIQNAHWLPCNAMPL